jgi:hypothetical protein
MPFPEGSERTPFGVVLLRVQCDMFAMGFRRARIDGVPEPNEG